MIETYYDGDILNDVLKVREARNFNKRELGITLGASILGMACYGIMKYAGYDDLVSNYPLFAFYGLTYLEGVHHRKRILEAGDRLYSFSQDQVDEKDVKSFYDCMVNSRLISSQAVIKSDDRTEKSITTQTLDLQSDAFGGVSQETTNVIGPKGATSSEVKTLKLTRKELMDKTF